ncbi:MAG: MerR family transcriptional regulator [Methylovirgula sp.]
MLISEFVRESGLSKDTVRFYVRQGLLTPDTNGKGGRNPYQVFTPEHVRVAALIRLAQSLGMSLKEIAAIGEEYARDGGISPARSIEIMNTQLSRLEQKAAEIDSMARYMRAKLAWLKSGAQGPEPDIGNYIAHVVPVACAENSARSTGTSRPKLRSAAR